MNQYQTIIIRSKRKTVSLKITDAHTLEVRAPLLMSDQEISDVIQRHRKWIEKHLAQQSNFTASSPRFSEADISTLIAETKQFLPGILQAYESRLGVRPARITIRCQTSKWGSCSGKGTLSFNCLLALAPDHVRQYVVLHELCHLKFMNHSADFWNLVAKEMPDYKRAKEWLKTEGQKLIEGLKQS